MNDWTSSPWATKKWSANKWNGKQWGGGKYVPPVPTEEEIDSLASSESTDPKSDKKYLSYKIDITSAENVRSLAIRNYRYKTITGFFNDLIRVRKRFFKVLESSKTISDETTIARLDHIQNRWKWMIDLENKMTPSDEKTLPVEKQYIYDAIADDKLDYPVISAEKYKYLKAEMENLHAALEKYLDSLKILSEEYEQIKRYDNFFNSDNSNTIRNAIKVSVTAADIKAMIMQETGDLIAGGDTKQEEKTGGIPLSNSQGSDQFIGICQMNKASRVSAEKWAQNLGVTIGGESDPRTLPYKAVLLTAAYLGLMVDKVMANLPSPRPDDAEIKKMAWAAYNIGPSAMKRVLLAFKEKYKDQQVKATYALLADLPETTDATGQANEYVIGIMRRLTWKD